MIHKNQRKLFPPSFTPPPCPKFTFLFKLVKFQVKSLPNYEAFLKSEMKAHDFGSEGKVHLRTFHYDFFESFKMPWIFKYILFSSSPIRGGKMYSFGKVLEVMLREFVPPTHIWGPLPAQQSVAWTAGNYGEIGVKDKPGLQYLEFVTWHLESWVGLCGPHFNPATINPGNLQRGWRAECTPAEEYLKGLVVSGMERGPCGSWTAIQDACSSVMGDREQQGEV